MIFPKTFCLLFVGLLWLSLPAIGQGSASTLSLQQILNGLHSNYELLKYQQSLVQAKQAQKRAVNFERLPHLNTVLEANVASNNNLQGTYETFGLIPSVTGGTRGNNDLSPIAGDVAFAGLRWEALNFGEYKANENLAKADLLVQMNTLAATTYDLEGIAAAYYVELLRQYQLESIEQSNVTRLQQLKSSIVALVLNGIRPGVDTAVASAELSAALVRYYGAQKNFAQRQVQLSNLTGLAINQLFPDTLAGNRIMNDGMAYTFTAPVDTANHPTINLYASVYDFSKAKLKQIQNNYYPKLIVDADGWFRGSGAVYNDQYATEFATGYAPSRFNYLAGLTLTYDIFNIAQKRFNSSIFKYQAEAASHRLANEKQNLASAIEQARLEKDYELNRSVETKHQLDEAGQAFQQQLSLYNSGLSSIIELNTALRSFIQAQEDYENANADLMRSVLNYSLVTNSFTGLVQTLKL